jgi:hypothetical protein
MSAGPDCRVYIQEGFRWDEQHAYLFDIDGTLLRHRDRIHFDAFFESVRAVMGRDLALDGVTLAGNTDPGILLFVWPASRSPNGVRIATTFCRPCARAWRLADRSFCPPSCRA